MLTGIPLLYVVDKITKVVALFFFKSRPPYQVEKKKEVLGVSGGGVCPLECNDPYL